MKDSNKSYYNAVNKLNRNIKAGKNENRIFRDKSKVTIQKDRVIETAKQYVVKKLKSTANGTAASTLFERKYEDEKKKKEN